jgi:thiamine pyrophosphate-dependent acetolactate synthase large subunit-like protein
LVLDCDVPWVNTQNKPRSDAKVYHIDVDPLKQQMPVFYIDALARFKADSAIAIGQILAHIKSSASLQQVVSSSMYQDRKDAREASHHKLLATIASAAKPSDDGSYNTSYLSAQLKRFCPADTIWCVEAVTETLNVADQIQATIPGSWLNCGGGGLGWSGGASLGIKLAANDQEGGDRFVCQIVGDGTFLFTVPGSVYWVAKRYKIPTLTVVLNNNGWNAPKRSLLLVHPDGVGSRATREEMNIAFTPTPDYAGIAKAAAGGDLWAVRCGDAKELAEILPEAVRRVRSGVSVVIDAHLGGDAGKYCEPNSMV